MQTSVQILIITLSFFAVVIFFLKDLFLKAKTLKISVQGIEFSGTGTEFANLFERTCSRLLRRDQIELFQLLLAGSQNKMVHDFYPNFDRENETWCKSEEGEKAIGTLRALRGIGFIEPNPPGRWEPSSIIIVNELGAEFGRRMSSK